VRNPEDCSLDIEVPIHTTEVDIRIGIKPAGKYPNYDENVM
jgi:hypothetical protein